MLLLARFARQPEAVTGIQVPGMRDEVNRDESDRTTLESEWIGRGAAD